MCPLVLVANPPQCIDQHGCLSASCYRRKYLKKWDPASIWMVTEMSVAILYLVGGRALKVFEVGFFHLNISPGRSQLGGDNQVL